jgi:hypothetical protein
MAVELLYVRRGDLWPRWSELASSTRSIRAPDLHRAAPLQSGLETLSAAVGMLRSDAEVLYLHNPGDLPAAFVAMRMKGVPVAVPHHLPPPFRQPEWLNRLIRQADAVITPSFDTANRWAQIAGCRATRCL